MPLQEPYPLCSWKTLQVRLLLPFCVGVFFSPTRARARARARTRTRTRTHTEMKIVAAYLLAVLGGNANPSAADLKDILGSVGVEAEDERIDFLLSEVKGKDITELIASGREKFASVPSGGGVSVAVAPSAGGSAAAAPAATESKKEEKVEEKEESDEDMGFSLFD